MTRNSGATWYASLSGQKNEPVTFDVTYADGRVGSTGDSSCFNGAWPVETGSVCEGEGSSSPSQSQPSPVAASTASPTASPPTASSSNASGCCSHDFKTCVSWCGTTKAECDACSPDAPPVIWLENGALTSDSCIARWDVCTNDNSGCCDGLSCISQGTWSQCLYEPTAANPPVGSPTAPTPTAPAPTALEPTAPNPSPTAPIKFNGKLFSTTNALSIWQVYEGLSSLTYKASSNPLKLSLVAEGGASGSGGSIVSEGQAYAILITGIILASWDTHAVGKTEADRQEVIDSFYGYFNGWVSMCQLNQPGGSSCQAKALCVDGSGKSSICLPDWKVKKDFSASEGTGPAPDGDEDAIVGMIYAVMALASDTSKPDWYGTVAAWADASISAFMQYETNTDEAGFRLLKLGSCWGGWESSGNNPSYHSPGSYKIMRDYHVAYSGSRSYQTFSSADFGTMISTSYKVLDGTQVSE